MITTGATHHEAAERIGGSIPAHGRVGYKQLDVQTASAILRATGSHDYSSAKQS